MGKRKLKPGRTGQPLAMVFFAMLAAIYLLIFMGLCHTPIYDLTGGHNDRFFSADDFYYVTGLYALPMDTSPQIIKHPLLVGFGALFTMVERALLGEVSQVLHYRLIVGTQIFAALLSVFYLYRILERRFRLPAGCGLLLCGIYGAAMSTLFYTFIAESYIWSSLLLIMTYWYAAEDRPWITVLLGALTAGVTITNGILWSVIVAFSDRERKERLRVLICGGLLFCLLVALLPIGRQFFANVLSGGINSARHHGDHYDLFELSRRIFYAFFGSTAFYLDTVPISPFGGFRGDALSFVPLSSWPVTVMGLLWMGLLIRAVVRHGKNRLIRPALGVLVCNLTLHGLIQFGLKEAFLYSLHHLSAQILIVAMLLVPGRRRERNRQTRIYWALVLYFCMELLLNIPGYREMLALVGT